VSTTGWQKSKKKEVCGQPTVETRVRTHDGSESREGALAEQDEAGSGLGRRPLRVGKLNSKQQQAGKKERLGVVVAPAVGACTPGARSPRGPGPRFLGGYAALPGR
jgi:hypothetical protein